MSLTNCRICDSTLFDKILDVKEMMFGTRKTYKYYKCSTCGVLQIEHPVQDPDLLYPAYYRSFSSSESGLKATLKKKLVVNSVARALGIGGVLSRLLGVEERKDAIALKNYLGKNTSVLDVGCGTGELLSALYTLGYKNISGVDPYVNTDLVENGWKIRKAFVTDLTDERQYDIVMLHHSFEHMDNPGEILKKVRTLLSKDGICMIRIPVCDSYAFNHYKENWVQIDAPRHVFVHTNKSMELLSHQAGLRIDKIVDDSGIFQFVGSEQYNEGISINSSRSFYQPFYKKIFNKHIFSTQQIDQFNRDAENLNRTGMGDQRIFILKNKY